MSFKEVVETAQAAALANRLYPDELAVWLRSCREYSEKFHEPLTKVLDYNPEFVLTHLYSAKLDGWDLEERLEDVLDMVGSLSDPDYDAKKERALREENRKIIEEEKERIKEGRAIHRSLEKKDRPKSMKELPKSGGLNMDLINQLNKENQGDSET